MPKNKKIGILTGGGDCPGLNAVIRAVTKSAHENGYDVIGFKDGFKGLVENDFIELTDCMVSNILTQGGTILGTSNTANPYRWAKKDKKGNLIFEDLSEKAISNFKKNKLEALVVLGGDGSMAIANDLVNDGLSIVGVPKTIDNDLPHTDMTFGFNTAVRTATGAIDKIHTTAQSHHRAMVVEVMGRYTGWIALYSGVAGGGDIILIPEIPYEIKSIYKTIKERKENGKNFTIIVVAEGAKPKGGDLTVRKVIKNSPDPIRLGGIGMKLANEIEENTGIESRATILGHIQRGGVPTPFDRVLATRFGVEAVNHVLNKRYGKMVVLKNNEISSVLISSVTSEVKNVPKNYSLIKAARAVGTCFGD
jgi:6-phosphofructokinase 1